MKIAIPVNENDMNATICDSFGRAPCMLFYNTETKQHECFDNQAMSNSGGAGIKAAQMIADKKAEVLLTPRCGENAASLLKAAGIKLYKTEILSVKDAIDAFLAGNLSILNDIHSGFYKHGGC